MIVIESTPSRICIGFTDTEVSILQRDIDNPQDFSVHDLRSLIEFIMRVHIETIDSRLNL